MPGPLKFLVIDGELAGDEVAQSLPERLTAS
jgi:hypothetical protein